MQIAHYQTAVKATEEAKSMQFRISFCAMFLYNQHERGPNALGVQRTELPRRDHFRDTNDVEFQERYREMSRDR